jgi:xylulose-5-phosphate/fructose-6-phosphate phosphoketolase
LAAITVLRQWAPELQIRVTLEKSQEDPHRLDDEAFERIFTSDKPIIMAFHGYLAVVHKLTYNRGNHGNFHVHGFRGEGTTTTPFDMTVLNGLDRYSLALNAIRYGTSSPPFGRKPDSQRNDGKAQALCFGVSARPSRRA